MKTFGTDNLEWRDADGVTHVIVATKLASWEYLCRADPKKYVTWDNNTKPPVEEPTADPVVWKHDPAKINCVGCLEMLDGATLTFVPIERTS